MDRIPIEITLSEMYSGPGGLGLGAKYVGIKKSGQMHRFKHIWASDYDRDTCETYKKNFEKNSSLEVLCSDVRNLNINNLTPTHGFMFGFPCNDFSLVGQSKGLDGKFGPLYSYGVKYISVANPLFFLAENVGGLSSANSGKAMGLIIEKLSNAGKVGYNITSHLYKFEEYMVPQARHRYVFIGIRKDLEKFFKVPIPCKTKISCSEAITEPPIPDDAFNHEFTRQSDRVIQRLKYIRPGENAWNAKIPEELQLNVKGAKLSQIYKRLEKDKPSYTVTGSGGGGTHIYHWSENRALTNRERARLQTFPDNFKFFGSKESVRKQIGMAVPPVAAEIILRAVLKTLLGIKYEFTHPNHGYF